VTPDGVYDGVDERALAARLAVPLVRAYAVTSSTQDEAHRLAAGGAAAGTIVIADAQTAGRGRGGKRWASGSGAGIWLSLIERPLAGDAVEVLSLRIGLAAARVLDGFAGECVRLKWPNDLHLAAGKLAGVLIEARWRTAAPDERRLDWVTIGIGINVRRPPDSFGRASLLPTATRLGVLDALVPALRAAASATGTLADGELVEYRERDLARGRRCASPAEGVVEGIDASGALIVVTADGRRAYRGGSLILEGDAA
jgi:BirA family transcriptional regulator, biotin operon repressor / biotin---[acetyl-CoA-carboxylase] ligase